MSEPKPSVGRIVHVALPVAHCVYEGETAAAIVTAVDEKTISLTAFPAGRLPYCMICSITPRSDAAPNTWSWPPRA